MKLLYHIRKNMVCLTKMYCYSYERVSLFTSLLKVSFGKKQHKKHLPLLFLIFHWLIRSFQQKVFSFSFHLCFSIFLTVIKMIFAEVVSKKVCCPIILFSLLPYFGRFPLCKICPYSEFFWSAFFRIWTEFGDLLSDSLYSVQVWENMDQKNSEYGTFYAVFIWV